MTATGRRGGGGEAIAVWTVLGGVALGVGVFWADTHLVHAYRGGPRPADQPIVLMLDILRGRFALQEAHAWVAGGLLLILAAVLLAGAVAVDRLRGRRHRVDRAAAHMGHGRDLAPLTTRGATAIADRLGAPGPGLPLGVTVAGGAPLWQDWESVAVHIWGPRQGKTMSAAIPALLAAPGAALATSNKRDLTDATRDLRGGLGRVWVFDPQGLAGEEPTWWWDPLSYVTDEVQAMKLAKVLASAARDPGARVDAYFDKAGPSLIGHLLHAAALDRRPITQVYLWLTDPAEDEPAVILRRHGFELSAKAVEGVVHAPEKQRGGIYGTAQELLGFLVSRATAAWVTDDVARRPQFDPAAFVSSTDTLYLLSKEGDLSTGPLVTALTVAVTEAAEALAAGSAHGRLPVPLVLVLDEAANICRWHALPDLYSHFGSRGIPVITFLQSWSQGVDVWGREGMRKLWSAANIRVLGSGVAEDAFLEGLTKLIGSYWRTARSGSRTRGARTTSWSQTEERVLDVADLAALPKGRSVLFASGARPVLLRTVPWTAGPHAGAVRASIVAHDPVAARTLAAADRAGLEHDVPAPGAAWLP